MSTLSKIASVSCFSFLCVVLLSFKTPDKGKKISFPYQQNGLTTRQAAAHLLSRFTFGAKPGDIDRVVSKGLERWFVEQLQGDAADNEVNKRLQEYSDLQLSNSQIASLYPQPGQLLRMAEKEGLISRDSINITDRASYRSKLAVIMKEKGVKPRSELFRQFINQKIIRATYSNNQLHELLTEFWFNHFNVSATNNNCAIYIPAYERDIIRPHVTANFEELVMATAQSPAMLIYLDNFISAANTTSQKPTMTRAAQRRLQQQMAPSMDKNAADEMMAKVQAARQNQGLNENYARELMELHTLGVDGGYTQKDVTEAARILTGWTVYPIAEYGPLNAMKKYLDRIGEEKLTERGFVKKDDFLFALNRHDAGEKTVLGKKYEGTGYDEGVQLIHMLANHTSTAKFICKKIAIKFVCDEPPASLVEKMTQTFLQSGGSIKEVLITMASAPEFWSDDALRQKTKSPFELAISSVRALDADVNMPFLLNTWITRMGQKLYYYQAPTGYPDRGKYWINTGALLNRMNFGLALANGKIPGVQINHLALNKGHEPESAEDALETFGKLLLPERDLSATIKRLTPLLNDPQLEKKIEKAAQEKMNMQQVMAAGNDDDDYPQDELPMKQSNEGSMKQKTVSYNKNMLNQVVGIIIGSPEFQRK